MNLQIGLYISVKFRVLGVTLGSIARALALGIDTSTGKITFGDGPAPGSMATTLINERGIMVQAWI